MKRLVILALAISGCASIGDAEYATPETDQGERPDMRPPSDMGDMGAVDCGVDQVDGGCGPPLPTCDAVDRDHAPGTCVDADGDCFPEACEAPLVDALRDCDDTRADVSPGAVEICNDRDDDCDGQVDEGFDIGRSCAACDMPGKIECAVADPSRTACSTALGQSAGPDAVEAEVCDGVDQDCDDRVDEACALADAEAVEGLRVCQEIVVVERDGGVESAPLEGMPVRFAARGDAPSCRADVVAWRALSDASECDPESGLCTDATLFVAGRPRHAGVLGRPHLNMSGAVLTEQTADGVRVVFVPRDDGAPIELATALLDPVPTEHGVVGRSVDAPVEVIRVLDGVRYTLDAPSAPPGEPVVADGFAAWITVDSAPIVWLVPLPDGAGLQIGPALAGRPWIVAGGLYWVDAAGLQRFDLRTGSRLQLLGGPLEPGLVDVGEGGIGWVEGAWLRISPLP